MVTCLAVAACLNFNAPGYAYSVTRSFVAIINGGGNIKPCISVDILYLSSKLRLKCF